MHGRATILERLINISLGGGGCESGKCVSRTEAPVGSTPHSLLRRDESHGVYRM
jgi:hypothetical protein